MMELSKEWKSLVDAENSFYAARHKFLSNKENLIGQLKMALKSNSKGTALRLLATSLKDDQDIIQEIVKDLIYISIDEHVDYLLTARQIIGNISIEWLKSNVEKIVSNMKYVDDEWTHRKFIELYETLGLTNAKK
jgi:hypothetical protein